MLTIVAPKSPETVAFGKFCQPRWYVVARWNGNHKLDAIGLRREGGIFSDESQPPTDDDVRSHFGEVYASIWLGSHHDAVLVFASDYRAAYTAYRQRNQSAA